MLDIDGVDAFFPYMFDRLIVPVDGTPAATLYKAPKFLNDCPKVTPTLDKLIAPDD
jgi:hypothetical protein